MKNCEWKVRGRSCSMSHPYDQNSMTSSAMRHDAIESNGHFDDVIEYEIGEDYILNDVSRDNHRGHHKRTGSDQSGTGSSGNSSNGLDDVTDEKVENLKKMLAESMNIEIKQSNINIYM